jgi:hypothetical protein
LEERCNGIAEVVGSSPTSSTRYFSQNTFPIFSSGDISRQAFFLRTLGGLARVVPKEQHTVCGKEPCANGVYRTLEQRFTTAPGAIRAQNLSFSKLEEIHELCLRLFLPRNNLSVVSPDRTIIQSNYT